MTTDENLMLEFQRGSTAAFSEMFDRYREAVYGFFRRRLEDAGRAEDLVQETFLALLRATERYEPRAPFRAYIFGIGFKLLAAERRKIARERSGPDGHILGETGVKPGEPELKPALDAPATS